MDVALWVIILFQDLKKYGLTNHFLFGKSNELYGLQFLFFKLPKWSDSAMKETNVNFSPDFCIFQSFMYLPYPGVNALKVI